MWPMLADLHLAQLLCARLCHDLGGVVGTLGSTLDLAAPGDDELQALARETAGMLRQRLMLYSAAWGLPGEDRSAEELAGLLAAAPASPRVRFQLTGLARGGRLPGALVPLALNAALLGAEALPRGGVVALSGGEAGLVVLPEGPGAAWPKGLEALLDTTTLAPSLEQGPRRVVTPLLGRLAAAAQWEVSFALGAGPGLPPLVLGPA
jgi:histidine phosphotransferase ChpT